MGLNESDRLKSAGLVTKKASTTKAPLYQLTLKREGPTAHPRADLAPDEALVQHIMKNGMRAVTGEPWRFLVRDNGKGAEDLWPEIEIINGSRRDNAGLEAERRLRESAPRMPPLVFDKKDESDLGRLYVEVELFTGSDAELILARLAANSEPGKLPDSIEVLALTVAQFVTLTGITDAKELLGVLADLQKVMPPGTTAADVSALSRWKNLTPEARTALVEANAPVHVLTHVLAVKRSEQVAMARKLIESGAKDRGMVGKEAKKERAANGHEVAFKWSPRKLEKLAKHVESEKVGSARDRAMLSAGLLLASGRDLDQVGLPPDIVQFVKEFKASLK